jgi:hypothetical protein
VPGAGCSRSAAPLFALRRSYRSAPMASTPGPRGGLTRPSQNGRLAHAAGRFGGPATGGLRFVAAPSYYSARLHPPAPGYFIGQAVTADADVRNHLASVPHHGLPHRGKEDGSRGFRLPPHHSGLHGRPHIPLAAGAIQGMDARRPSRAPGPGMGCGLLELRLDGRRLPQPGAGGA